jgi:hypothetical protein
MIPVIEFLVKILDLVLSLIAENKKNETLKEYKAASDNPRDFFDDGLLNNSDTKQSTSTVSKTSTTREPE